MSTGQPMTDAMFNIISINTESGATKTYKRIPWKRARQITKTANDSFGKRDSPLWFVMFNPATSELEIPIE